MAIVITLDAIDALNLLVSIEGVADVETRELLVNAEQQLLDQLYAAPSKGLSNDD